MPVLTWFRGLLIAGVILTAACTSPSSEKKEDHTRGTMLPKVLFITSGISDEVPKPAPGVIIAVQSFNKRGIPVRLEPRDILYNYAALNQYAIIILPTFPGYHDADRKYSLSYMSDEELGNIERFVRNGGVIITGDNAGRNYTDGTDRATLNPLLTPDNWALAKCFGASFAERNVGHFGFADSTASAARQDLSFAPGILFKEDMWVLVPEQIRSDSAGIIFSLVRGGDTIPGLLRNRHGKGIAYFLTSTGFLHPSEDGGYWSIDQADRFYGMVADDYNRTNGIGVALNPWPDGASYALSISINALGERDGYERLFSKLKEEGIRPTLFVPGTLDRETREFLLAGEYPLASGGYSFINFREVGYPLTVEEILRNEVSWGTDFKGFRFPYTQPSFFGLYTLGEHGYHYESSIAANNLEFIHGAVVPYNLVISRDGLYKATDLLEIGPAYHDDFFFLNLLDKTPVPDSGAINKAAGVYGEYLKNFWVYAVKPWNGIMVFLGHPRYVGHNAATMSALTGLVGEAKKDGAWIATLEEVAEFRKGLASMTLFSLEDNAVHRIGVSAAGGIRLQRVCLTVEGEVKSAETLEGNIKILHSGNLSRLVFDAFDGQIVSYRLKE